MSNEPPKPGDPDDRADAAPSQRETTDKSLRAERGDIDRMIQELADVDATADAAITRARERADEILAASRAKTDSVRTGPRTESSRILLQARSVEDRARHDERTVADEALQDARTQKVSRLAAERRETDEDLSSERAKSDNVLAMRDEVLQLVSHDLRNMLGTIMGMAGLIEEDGDPAEGEGGTVAHARWIMKAAVRMNRLVGDLTDTASIEAGTLAIACQMSDPAAIAGEAVATFRVLAADHGIALAADIASPLPRAWFDPARIYQVITNLLSNAIKFTPKGGKVVVHVDRLDNELRFAVSDTGIGIAPELLTTVFSRNVQLAKNDRRGAGLGLYISRSIVQRHGGRIWAESTPGAGARFVFTVPLSEQAGTARS